MTATRRTRRRPHAKENSPASSQVSPIPAPDGLALAFAMLGDESFVSTATRACPAAQQYIADRANGATFSERGRFDDAVDRMFPWLRGKEPSEEPTEATCAEAGFLIGFATCWLLMRRVNGGAQ